AGLRRGGLRGPYPVPWLLAAACMVHVFAAAPWFLGWTAFTVLAWCIPLARPHAGRALRLLLAAAACCAPILGWRYLVSYAPVNLMHTHVEGFLRLPFGYVIEPLSWVNLLGSATWLSLLASPFYLAHHPAPERLLACVGLWVGVGVLFNPLLTPLLAPRLGYLLIRLYPVVLGACVLGGWVVDQLRVLAAGPAGRRAAAVAWLAVVAVALAPEYRGSAASYQGPALAVEEARSPAPWRPTLDFLERAYPQPQVVASDPVTCYGIAGLTRHDVVATLNQHSSPSDTEAVARMQAASDILSPACPPARTAARLAHYGVDLVVVNHTFGYPLLDYLASVSPPEYPGIEAKFSARPEVFREVFHAPGQWVYEVRREALPAYARLPGPAWPELAPPSGRAPVELGCGTWLADARLAPPGVAPGGPLWLDCLFRRDRPAGPGERFVLTTSLSTRPPEPPRWLPPRLARLVAQRRDHRQYRVTQTHLLRADGGSPEYWPAGRWVRCRLPLAVPGGLAPGPYALRARVEPQEFRGNLNLSWYFEDDDRTPGGVLQTVHVASRPAAGR
ncbi:MAG TPA: hypothetical protein VMS93_03430, partial [Candidatus Saccharimonadales bacterium]|nr:hypothetical protein [Candidatus Saccharimonadales bacterium]